MNTKQKRESGIEAWARQAKPSTGGRMCAACMAGDKVVSALKTLSEMRKRRETRATMTAIREEVLRRYGVDLPPWTLQGHFANCLRAPWGRA